MSSVKKISRNDLYSDDEIVDDEEELILPKLDFEIIEAADNNEPEQIEEEKEEFDFPLFSFGAPEEPNNEDTNEESVEKERGRSSEKSNTLRISLRSPSPETIDQERPRSYYFAEYTEEEKSQFAQSAIEGDFIIDNSKKELGHFTMGKVINLEEYNSKIEALISRQKKEKKIRPGKKSRLASIKSRENNTSRSKIKKNIELAIKKKEERKLLKKIHHKRGGKKNKKKTVAAPAADKAKPKYRTE